MSQLTPRDLFDHSPLLQMEKALIGGDPDIPRTVLGDGMHVSARHRTHGNKPAILEVSNPAGRGDPNSPLTVLKERPSVVIGQPFVDYLAYQFLTVAARKQPPSLAVNRNLPVIPSVQAINRAKPNAAISGRQNGPGFGIRQTLFDGNGGDGEVAKAIDAIRSGYPNIAFAILKESPYGIAGESVRLRKHIRPFLVHMQEPKGPRSDPQTAIVIPEQLSGIELRPNVRKGISFGFPINEPSHSADRADQKRAVVVFVQSVDLGHRA